MKVLTRQELQTLHASDEQKFEAAGVALWPEAAVDEIKAKRLATEVSTLPPLPIRLLFNFFYFAVAFPFFGVALLTTWLLRYLEGYAKHLPRNKTIAQKALAFYGEWAHDAIKFRPMQMQGWQTQPINPAGVYRQNWDHIQAPRFVVDTMDRIRALFSEVEFEVSFYGTDPILICTVVEEEGRRRYYPLVWDIVDGAAVVLTPPT